MEHVYMVNDLLRKYEGRDVRDIMSADNIAPLIVFEPNKDYLNTVLKEQVDLQPFNMRLVRMRNLPEYWKSFDYQRNVNAGGVPSEIVVQVLGKGLAQKATEEPAVRAKTEMAKVRKGGPNRAQAA
jgi:hypothetical protein